MAVSRFNIASNKKSALLKQNMRACAVLLAEDPPKEEKARIKAESLIRDDYMIEAFDILSLNCELLSERIKLIAFSKECPPDLVSCVSTLIYAAPRVDIPELVFIRKQFRAKFGKKFEEDALNNVGGVLNERVVTKLSVQPPAAYLVQTYLEKICERFEVDWSPTVRLNIEQMGEPMAPPVGFSVPIAQGTGLGAVVATTGHTVSDEEITYDGSQMTAPPKAPTSTPRVPTSSNNTPTTQYDDFAEPDIFIPVAPGQSGTSFKASSSVTPSAPPPVPPSAPPAAPSAPPADDIPPAPTQKTDNNDDDDDNDKDSGTQPPAGGPPAGGSSSSYRDLAARFDTLKKL
jgi:vacuolar protein sorting-associated protein IST1